MRFRPTPMTEAASTMAIQVLLTLTSYLIMTGSINMAFGMVYSVAILYMLPMFTLWAVIGLLVRRRTRQFRLLVNLSITTVVILGITLFFLGSVSKGIAAGTLATFIYVAGLLWLASITGGLVTYLYLVAPRKPKKK